MRIGSRQGLVWALTALGFGLRAHQLRQGLGGDELLTIAEVDHGFGGMLDSLRTRQENSPLQTTAAAVYRSDRLSGPAAYSQRDGWLVPAAGRLLPVRAHGVEGIIQPQERQAARYLYVGWAHRGEHPVDKVVVFSGSRVVFADAPDTTRPDLDPEGGQAFGFDFAVPLRVLRSTGDLTAYAVRRDTAYRLGYLCEAGVEQPIACLADAIRP
jgi:hypothetical protein